MPEIHAYDLRSGEFIETFTTRSEIERKYNLYRGAVGDALKKDGRCSKVLVSIQLHKIHPLRIKEPFSPDAISKDEPCGTLLSEDELRQKHDMFYAVQSYLKTLPEGKFIEELCLLRQLGLAGKPRYRDAISRPELKEFKGRVDGVTYYGPITSIRKLKQEGVLQ